MLQRRKLSYRNRWPKNLHFGTIHTSTYICTMLWCDAYSVDHILFSCMYINTNTHTSHIPDHSHSCCCWCCWYSSGSSAWFGDSSPATTTTTTMLPNFLVMSLYIRPYVCIIYSFLLYLYMPNESIWIWYACLLLYSSRYIYTDMSWHRHFGIEPGENAEISEMTYIRVYCHPLKCAIVCELPSTRYPLSFMRMCGTRFFFLGYCRKQVERVIRVRKHCWTSLSSFFSFYHSYCTNDLII